MTGVKALQLFLGGVAFGAVLTALCMVIESERKWRRERKQTLARLR